MKYALILLLSAFALFAADEKQLPNQAGNDDLDLQGTVLITPADIRQALGADMPPGYLIVRIKVTPKSAMPLRIGPDDFTLLSRKDGERSPAQTPDQVAGGGAVLVVQPANQQPGGDGTTVNGPVWGGVKVKKRGTGNEGDTSKPHVKDGGSADTPLVQALTGKALADKEYKEPAEGLLYFGYDGKLKPKNLSLIYNGQAGKLIIDFR